MTLPKLAVARSGFGGRGYKNPVTGDARIVPSVTTILKAEARPALEQWIANQTAAYAVANAQDLLSRSEEWAYNHLRWYHSKKIDPDAPDLDVANYWQGVRDDAADQGTWIHEYIQADVDPACSYPSTENTNQNHWDMVEAWDTWKSGKEIVPLHTEITVWNDEEGYAGTFDGMWTIDGRTVLMDIKSSRGIYSSAWMQLAALWSAPEAFFPQDDDTYIAVRDWVTPAEGFGILHIRPSDSDSRGRPMSPFCKWLEGEDRELHMQSFRGLLQYQHAQYALKQVLREREKNGDS